MSDSYPSLFIDTGAWIALNEKEDMHHKEARSFVSRNKEGDLNFGPIHTSDMILQETYTFLLYNYNQEAAIDIVERILDSNVIIHPFNNLDFRDIWAMIADERSELSFVDWSTVGFMGEYDIKHLFTFDKDFEGFDLEVLP